MNNFDQRLAENLELYGKKRIISHIMRTSPANEQEFIDILYEDIHIIAKELMGIADQLQDDNEDQLRSRVVLMLRRMEYDADAEPHRRGHSDIVVKCKHLNLEWIAEAKRHSKYDYLEEGMRQLLDRYTSGMDLNAALIVFVYEQKAQMVVERWVTYMNDSQICGLIGVPEKDGKYPLQLRSNHNHAVSGRVVIVSHIIIPLYFAPTDKSARKSAEPKTKPKTTKTGTN